MKTTACSICRKNFSKEPEFLLHYQICINQDIAIQPSVLPSPNYISRVSMAESDPFIPDMLSVYNEWSFKFNPDTGIGVWINEGALKIEGSYLFF